MDPRNLSSFFHVDLYIYILKKDSPCHQTGVQTTQKQNDAVKDVSSDMLGVGVNLSLWYDSHVTCTNSKLSCPVRHVGRPVTQTVHSPSSFSSQDSSLPRSDLISGGPSKDVAGSSSQGNQSLDRVASEADYSILRSQSSSSDSQASEVFPFEIWYRNNTDDALSDDPYSWVDPDIKKVPSALIRPNSLLGMAKAICQRGQWSVTIFPCRGQRPARSHEGSFFLSLRHPPVKLGVKLPFTPFKRSTLRVLNVAPTQLHLNNWAFVRAFELLCEDIGRVPSLSIFFWFFALCMLHLETVRSDSMRHNLSEWARTLPFRISLD
ncbi:hypothetical protein CR513_27977, partial [Mucuna pruriens]